MIRHAKREELHPGGTWINELLAFFLVVNIAAFALGAGFAWLAFKPQLTILGKAFSFFAIAESRT